MQRHSACTSPGKAQMEDVLANKFAGQTDHQPIQDVPHGCLTVPRLVTFDGVIADKEPGVPERRPAGAYVHAAVPAPLQSGVRSDAALLPCQICLMETAHPHASTCLVPPAKRVQHQGAGRIRRERLVAGKAALTCLAGLL